MKPRFIKIDRLKGRFYFNDYIFVDIRKLMFDFHDKSPEKVWPQIVEFVMGSQEGFKKSTKGYNQIITVNDINYAQSVINTIWNTNYKSLKKWDDDSGKII